MANFAFSAPEQLISGNKPAETMDVFAVGQVLNWYLRGRIVRGSGRSAYSGSENELAILDAIVGVELFECAENVVPAVGHDVPELVQLALLGEIAQKSVDSNRIGNFADIAYARY
ncbi:hypothetical protein [Rhizobium leguminosarum]|uniref:hypothetical protein n=1 Tax=Rhizobium leguminosarum TaxID=384 RepID=UPI003F9CD223